MKTAIILSGMPSKEEYYNPEKPAQSNKHWIPWIQRQLIINDILAQAIELPEPYSPVYEKWASVFEQFKIDQETILIGHSCGAGFLIRWLSENKVKVSKVALIAPWLNPKKRLKTNFFNFKIDKDLTDRIESLSIFYSTDDRADTLESVSILKSSLKKIRLKEFTNKRHFTLSSMKTEEFPELKDELLRK